MPITLKGKAAGKVGLARGRIVKVGGDDVPFVPGVQGISSSVDDVLLNGKTWQAAVGANITDASIERTIEGASSLLIDVLDPTRSLLESSLFEEAFDVEVDGLGFRYKKLGYQGIGEPLELTFEDREVARLRIAKGARKAVRGKVTRAEFARRLVREVKAPGIPFYCPQLHVEQPIATAAQGRAASDAKNVTRGGGLSAASHVTVKHSAADGTQIRTIERALDTAKSLHAPAKAMIAVVMCITQESDAGKEANAFQQNADWPGSANDVENATTNFLKRAPTYPGGFLAWLRRNPSGRLGEGIQAIQKSGASPSGSLYDQWRSEATDTVNKYLGGASGSASATPTTDTTKYQFERKKGETTWDCITRLASEVGWRCFVSAGVVYFIAETDLLRSKVRAEISDSTPGVEDTSFDRDAGKPIDEMTVSARSRAWGLPPGTVCEVTRHGAANGIWIVSKIKAPLRRENVLCDITLKRPAAALPEPAPATKTGKSGKGGKQVASSSGGSDQVDRMIAEADRIDKLHLRYTWGGSHGRSPTPANGPFDCSSLVSHILQVGGINIPTSVSGALARMMQAGPGKEVTVFANAQHAWMKLRGRCFSTHGGTMGWVSQGTFSEGDYTKRHPGSL